LGYTPVINERASDAIVRRAEFAEIAAREAAALALEFSRSPSSLEIRAKGHRDYVTAADAAVERLLRERIEAAFPGDRFLGEEGGGEPASHLWVVDPIDGTANYTRGLPAFAVSIAFCLEGRPVVGVIAEPVAATLYTARLGNGAFRSGVPIHTAPTTDIRRSMVEFGYTERRSVDDNLGLMRRLVDAGCDVRVIGSAALGLARVAEGRTDGYCELHLNSWDVLAGLLLVEEAGGRINDFLASEGLMRGNPVLAAAPHVAERLAEVTGLLLPS
jgi:myo-inositol-1(or 4)-monophosphatase